MDSVHNNPVAALRALAALVKNPHDLPQVFALIESLPGRSPYKMLERMKESGDGRWLLATRPVLSSTLIDRERLMALRSGTLGRTYAEFAAANGISAQGILDAAAIGRPKLDRLPIDIRFVEERMRDTHDLWHVATGYGTDIGGELAVLAFVLAQSFQPGIALICGLASLRGITGLNALMRSAYQRGKRAAWLPAVVWERVLDRPLDEVRALLRVGEAPRYASLTAEDLSPWSGLAQAGGHDAHRAL